MSMAFGSDRAAGVPAVAEPALGRAPVMRAAERRNRLTALLLAIAVAAFLVASKKMFFSSPQDNLPAVPHAAWVVPDEVMRGGQPPDVDFVNLRDLFGVTAVVNLRGSGWVEAAVVRGLGMQYIGIGVSPGKAPTVEQLAAIVGFLRQQHKDHGVVFIHDVTGLDRAPAVAAMLDMLRRVPTDEAARAVRAGLSPDALVFSTPQLDAMNALARDLRLAPYLPEGYVLPKYLPYRYTAARTLRW